MSAYDNLQQFAGQKDGATRCAPITRLLTSDWDVHWHKVDNLLVDLHFDIIDAFCSVHRQAQFDVLAEKASMSYHNGNVREGDPIPCAPSLRKYWGCFQSMQGHASTVHFKLHHLQCSKGGQQDVGFETVRFVVTIHPSIGRVFSTSPCMQRSHHLR